MIGARGALLGTRGQFDRVKRFEDIRTIAVRSYQGEGHCKEHPGTRFSVD